MDLVELILISGIIPLDTLVPAFFAGSGRDVDGQNMVAAADTGIDLQGAGAVIAKGDGLLLVLLNVVGIVIDIAGSLVTVGFAADLVFQHIPMAPYLEHIFTRFLNPPIGFIGLAKFIRIVIRFMEMAVVQSGHRQDDTGIDVGQGALDGVSALQHGDVRLEQAGR